MQEALELDRVEFVRLLLEHGVNMNKFLTVARLEDLYNSKRGPDNTLGYLVRDVVPRMPRSYRYTLLDIGLVINQLMGHGYSADYTQRKFRPPPKRTFSNLNPNNLAVSPVPGRKDIDASLNQSPSKADLSGLKAVNTVNGTGTVGKKIHKSLSSQTIKVSVFFVVVIGNCWYMVLIGLCYVVSGARLRKGV